MITNKVKEVIAEQTGVGMETLTLETTLKEDLNADSLDAVEVIMTLEDKFNIEVEDEDAESFKTIGDIVKYIETKV